MRIHGEVKINRRKDVARKNQYRDYLIDLQKDFCYICGYCGKSIKVTKNTFEIDHFIPKSFAPELEHEYTNLVYSCFTCNRKKSKKWPTADKNIHHDNKVGFIDPATDEYDLHLERLLDGSIRPLTEVGEYMCNKVFKFNLRPIKEIWLCEEIVSRQEQLESKISQMTPKESYEYIEINMQLKSLMQNLFSKKE